MQTTINVFYHQFVQHYKTSTTSRTVNGPLLEISACLTCFLQTTISHPDMFLIVVSDCYVFVFLLPVWMRKGVEDISPDIFTVTTFLKIRDFTPFHLIVQRREHILVIDQCFAGLAVVATDNSLQNALSSLRGSLTLQRRESVVGNIRSRFCYIRPLALWDLREIDTAHDDIILDVVDMKQEGLLTSVNNPEFDKA